MFTINLIKGGEKDGKTTFFVLCLDIVARRVLPRSQQLPLSLFLY